MDIRNLVNNQKRQLHQLTDFMLNVKTYSDDFKFTNPPKSKIDFYSYTNPMDKGIPIAEYKRKYYKNTPLSTSTNYVPDFEIPIDMLYEVLSQNELQESRLMTNCGQKIIRFKFKYRKYYPSDRIIYLSFFPKKICDKILLNSDSNPKGYLWNYDVDDYWLISSEKEL